MTEMKPNKFVYDLAESVGLDLSHKDDREAFDKFIEHFVDEISEVVCGCDTSPKMILHEPYRTVMFEIENRVFNPEHECAGYTTAR